MKIEEIRKMEIDVIKSLDNYSDYELVEIKRIADKMKEMAMYEEFCREKRRNGGTMKKYIEFCDIEFCDSEIDGYVSAADVLNKFIAENKHLKVSVIGYQVVRYEQVGADRTYILVEVEE